MTLQETLKRIREEARKSQYDIANELGITQPGVVHIEYGRRPLTIEQFVAWCNACGQKPHLILKEVYE